MVQSGLLRQSATVAREKPGGFIPCPAYPQKRWQKFGTRALIQAGKPVIFPVGSKSLTVPLVRRTDSTALNVDLVRAAALRAAIVELKALLRGSAGGASG